MGRDLGRYVEHRRKELGLSRRELVERSGLSYPYVSQIETGEREPALKALAALAGALDVGVGQLAGLVSGEDWSSGASPSARPAAVGFADTASSGPSTSERVDERALLAVERRLRAVPPLERLALLNRLLALTIDELGERPEA